MTVKIFTKLKKDSYLKKKVNFLYKEIRLILLGYIYLIVSDSKGIYNVTKDLYIKVAVLLNFLLIKELNVITVSKILSSKTISTLVIIQNVS